MPNDNSPDEGMQEGEELAERRGLRRDVLFVTDTEMLRKIGISEKIGRVAIRELEKRQVFPPKDPLFGNKRYWPAVRAFLDARSGLTPLPPGLSVNRPTFKLTFVYRAFQYTGKAFTNL
jgi:hypothetical protein